MERKVPRARFAPRLEALESRFLLSGGGPDRRRLWLAALADRDASPRSRMADVRIPRADQAPRARLAAAIVPDDAVFGQLWGLNNANDVDIDAPEAWAVTTGTPATIVAVLDTGIDPGHPELSSKVWTNPGEIAGNGLDDDGNGYVDDVHGWNFVASTNDAQDDNGHGTHVSGTIAAAGNNGEGVVGVNWNATIMPLKILGADGVGSITAAIDAIVYAARHGARVINASWAVDIASQDLTDAIRYAGSQGVVFVNAAGNERRSNDGSPAQDRARPTNQITVAAVDSSGALARFSNYGARSVDLAAPGVGILSTVPGGYASYTGTSMATPHVSGVVALLAGLHPELSAAELVNRVLGTTKRLEGLAGKTRNGGMVDSALALGVPGTNTAAANPHAGAARRARRQFPFRPRRVRSPIGYFPMRRGGELPPAQTLA